MMPVVSSGSSCCCRKISPGCSPGAAVGVLLPPPAPPPPRRKKVGGLRAGDILSARSRPSSRMSLILSWVLTLRISFEDVPLLARRSCCGVGIEGPEAEAEVFAVVTVLALATVGKLVLGAGMADGEWEKEEEEDGHPSGRGTAIAARPARGVAQIRLVLKCQGWADLRMRILCNLSLMQGSVEHDSKRQNR